MKKKLSNKFQKNNQKFIFFSIDSVSFKNFNLKTFPKLLSLKKNSIFFKNFYVHAAPTQQSFQSYFTMNTPLHGKAYDFGLQKKKTLFQKLRSEKFFLSSINSSVFFSEFYSYPKQFNKYKLHTNLFYQIYQIQKHYISKLMNNYISNKMTYKKFVIELEIILNKLFKNLIFCIESKEYQNFPKKINLQSKSFIQKLFIKYKKNKKNFIFNNFKNLNSFLFFHPYGQILKFLPYKIRAIIEQLILKLIILKNLQPSQKELSELIYNHLNQDKIKSNQKLFFWSHFLDPHDSISNTNNFCKKFSTSYNANENYILSLRNTDKMLFKLIENLRKIKEYEDAYFIISSDHGANLNQRTHITKNFDNDIVHVPLFIYKNDIKKKIISSTIQNSEFLRVINYLRNKDNLKEKKYLYFENKGRGYTKFNNENAYLKIKTKEYVGKTEVFLKKRKLVYTNPVFKKYFQKKKFMKYKNNLLKYLNDIK